MTVQSRKLRPPVKTHGGKYYLADWIIDHFPPHRVYHEPYLGGGSILINKDPAEVSIGILDDGLINMYWVLQNQLAELTAILAQLPYNQGEFDAALDWMMDPDPVWRAVGFLVRRRWSRGGFGKTFADAVRPRGGLPGDQNSWKTFLIMLPRISDRLQGVEIHLADGVDLIREYDAPDVLHYLDPTYLPETRTAHKAYGEYDMDREDHEELLDVLLQCEGSVILSGYPSSLYKDKLAGWYYEEKEVANNSGQGDVKQMRTEALWMNY